MKKAIIESSRILISVKEASEYAELSEKTMRSLMRKNGFMSRIGRRTLIRKDLFETWLSNRSEYGEIPAAKKENKALIIESPRGLLSVKEVCEYTGLSEKTVRSSLMRGNGFMVKIGRRTLIHKKAFEKWLTAQTGRM